MKKFLVICLCAGITWAQDISGRVTKLATGQPLGNVSVTYVSSATDTKTTDGNGMFAFGAASIHDTYSVKALNLVVNGESFAITLPQNMLSQINVIDVSGRVAATLLYGKSIATQKSLTLAHSGLYWIQVSVGNQQIKKPFTYLGKPFNVSIDVSTSGLAKSGEIMAGTLTFHKTGYVDKSIDASTFTGTIGLAYSPDSVAKYPGYTLELSEEFDTPINFDIDPIWTFSDGGWPDNDVRFTKDGIKFVDGKMQLVITKETVPASTSIAEGCPNAAGTLVPKAVLAKNYKGGEMRTKENKFRYGRYEVRMKPPTQGRYVATMFTYYTPRCKHWREIDVEPTGSTSANYITNVFYTNNEDQWRDGISASGTAQAGASPTTGWNTYVIDWLPTKITWYYNGAVVRSYNQTTGIEIPQLSSKIMMNFWIPAAITGGLGGDATKNTFPMTHEYEWFKYYRWNSDADKVANPEKKCQYANSIKCAGIYPN